MGNTTLLPRFVLDTNVLVSALRSRRGASHELLRRLDDVLDRLCARSEFHDVPGRRRPILPDPSDEHVLELALAARADGIVTHNLRDFRVSGDFGVRSMAPRDALEMLGGLQ